jgi:hypothetical protein
VGCASGPASGPGSEMAVALGGSGWRGVGWGIREVGCGRHAATHGNSGREESEGWWLRGKRCQLGRDVAVT